MNHLDKNKMKLRKVDCEDDIEMTQQVTNVGFQCHMP